MTQARSSLLDGPGSAASDLSGGALTVIQPSSGWVPIRLSDLWQYRQVLYFLIWRDIKVRYKQTVIGVGWALIQPLMTMLVFSIVLGRLAKMPSDGVPYPVFSLCALVPWTFFANGLTQSSLSLVSSTQLITKVYFPRLFIPTARVLAGLLDLGFASLVLLGISAYYGFYPSRLMVLWIPVFVGLALTTALGVGLWLSALNVKYRDIQHAIPFLTQLWLFATPIAYPTSLLPGRWRTLYALNPMVGVVDGFRWALLGSGYLPGPTWAVSILVPFLVLVTGAFFFRRAERTFADVL